MMVLDKYYDPKSFEEKHYQRWESQGTFDCHPQDRSKPYVIMMPPPNVTGRLHMGHALTFTLQDILVRYHRMQGFDVLWQPGQDHAGIATQMVVEKNLKQQGITRQSLGREAFLEKIWEWKAQYGDSILEQQRRLGCSADWSRLRFTMDEGLCGAVRKVFVDLYHQGKIYKDKKLVNWDPVFQTAISDLEVVSKEVKGTLWVIHYPVVGHKDVHIPVATTRPETLFGDVAVAVNPNDPRYQAWIGQMVHLPLTDRKIPIVADSYADPDLGTGAVKITPGHDFNDFEVGMRHGLPVVNIFDSTAHLNHEVPQEYQGIERFKARQIVLDDLRKQGLLIEERPHTQTIPHGERSDAVVEPWLTDQWFLDVNEMADRALKAVMDGKTKFFPGNWSKTYHEWLRNIQPWCISRQIWWGHRIPAWYGPNGDCFVAESEGLAQQQAHKHYGKDVTLIQDENVLDTWFSSALWPFSTLDWPDKTEALKKYYPGQVLVTGFDIIFFWVARMMMMGLHFMDDVPFRHVYIHALIRDAQGQKMSKTKGNVIDPLDVCDQYGADSLRFTLCALASQGRDIKLSLDRVEGYRNFITKLWNAARFAQHWGCEYDADFNPTDCKGKINQWMMAVLLQRQKDYQQYIETYQFNHVAQCLYRLVWNDFCDRYVEWIKPILANPEHPWHLETKQCCAWVLRHILLMMHPVTPFVTEELWAYFSDSSSGLLAKQLGPNLDILRDHEDRLDQGYCLVCGLMNIHDNIKSLRSVFGVPPTQSWKISMSPMSQESDLIEIIKIFEGVAHVQNIEYPESGSQDQMEDFWIQHVLMEGYDVSFELQGMVDPKVAQQRIDQTIKRLNADAEKINMKLDNKVHLPQEKVVELESELGNLTSLHSTLLGCLKQLKTRAD